LCQDADLDLFAIVDIFRAKRVEELQKRLDH
jgi:hypothetical protein